MQPCPQEVIEMGAALVKARRKAAMTGAAVAAAIDKLDGAFQALPTGLRRMELGEALVHLHAANQAEGHLMMAHNSLRKLLAAVEVEEPTDAQINEILNPGGVSTQGGGGGGR